MAHFAKVEDGIVTNVIVAEQDFIDSGVVGDPATWIQTSYNTRGNKHYNPETNEEDDGVALRGNYAGIGYSYDEELDVFIPPKPYPSWLLNYETYLWEAPVSYPEDGKFYYWNEDELNWEEVVLDAS